MNITTRMMFSGTHFKHYFLFLLLAITIILVFIKSKSNFINTSFDVKEIAQIRDISDTKIKYYTKKTTVEIRKLGIRKTEKISSKIINLQVNIFQVLRWLRRFVSYEVKGTVGHVLHKCSLLLIFFIIIHIKVTSK